jgi:CubicO group peptidase (beta-lactamase class C family)
MAQANSWQGCLACSNFDRHRCSSRLKQLSAAPGIMRFTRLLLMALLVAVWSSMGLPVRAQLVSNLWEPQILEGRIDGLVEAQRQAHHFAGAVVVVVRDGKVLLEKGYGYADFTERKPVDPQRTLFRVASNSKMFIWTAVMQLVEQGRLDLHTDINRYLRDFQIPPAFGEPITLEHLMTHTAGFEERVIGLFSREPGRMEPLADLLKRDLPHRVFPPGKVTAYSNYGSALAALIVEQVSGMPFERYLAERILKPLGLEHTTLAQPVPPALAADVSKGYRWRDGRLQEQTFEFVPWAPCGGMSVSGVDMGRFMMAHLNDGALDGTLILKPETARLMRTRLTSYSPKLNGMLHGFMELTQGGQVAYGHGGDTIYFHSLTALLPEHRAGFFLAYNTDTGAAARNEFMSAFLDLLFPQPLAKEPAASVADQAKLARFAGTYAPARVSATDITKLAKLIEVLAIAIDHEGYLVTRLAALPPTRWRQIEPLVFREVDGHRRLVFREDERGEVIDACWSPFGVVAWQKQPPTQSPSVQFGMLSLFAVTMLAGAIGIPIAARRQRGQVKPPASRCARGLAWVVCAAFLGGLLAFALAMKDPTEIVFGPMPMLTTALGIWLVAAVLTIPLLGFVWPAWRRGWWQRTGRICLTLIASAAAGWIAWLFHWNMVGWHY